MSDQTIGDAIRIGAPMSALQRAYAVGRMPELPLGGIECLAYFEFRGRRFDARRLQNAVDSVHRHAALRCAFVLDDENPLLTDGRAPAPVVEIHEVSGDPDGGREAIREQMMNRTIDIGRGANWGVALSTGSSDDNVLHVVFSLAALDVAAIGVVLEELAESYAGHALAPDGPLESIEDVRSQLDARSRPRRGPRRWGRSPSLLPGPDLTGLSSASTGDTRMVTLRREMPQSDWEALASRAAEYKTSRAALLLTVYEHTLRQWSGEKDFCVTVASLDIRGTESIVADRTVAYAHRATDASEFADEVAAAAADLRRRLAEHRDVMTEMREAHIAGRPVAPSRCVFTYAAEMSVFTPTVLEVLGRPRSWGQTPQSAIDCRLVRLDEDTVEVAFDVRTAAMPLQIAEAVFDLYVQHLADLIESGAPRTQLPSEQAEMRNRLNSSAPLEPGLLYDGFRSHARRRPTDIAIEESSGDEHASRGDTTKTALTYAELDERALTFASRLTCIASPGDLVAIQLPRGIDQVVAILGTLYAGCAYLPLSLGTPPARLERIRERSRFSALVTADSFPQAPARPLARPIERDPEDLAYVIFTSGSTGEPKGVAITHGSANNTIIDVNRRHCIGTDDVVLSVSGVDFDLSVYDVFGALGAGARLFITRESETRDPFRWGEIIRDSGVTVWNSVPMLLEMLHAANDSLPSLRTFLVSGDRIPLDLPARSRELSPGSTFVAMGGATEASIWSNEFVVTDDEGLRQDWSSVPYGRPLTGQRYRVVDDHGRDRPDACVGELLIGGAGVARGYYRDPERTAAAFIDDGNGVRWYRTGDLGMWDEGLIHFVGRRDNQVKIRGHRVECGEVEGRICEHPGVASATVVPIRERSALGALYVPRKAGAEPTSEELARHLGPQLPWYMVPAVFRVAAELPMTVNGKVDREKAVALVTSDHRDRHDVGRSQDPVASAVAEAWEQVLGTDVDADTNFFAHGGDSLAATRMCARLRDAGLNAALADLFRDPVLAAFADACRPGTPEEEDRPSAEPRPDWRVKASAEGVSLSSLGVEEWCRWLWRHELRSTDETVEIVAETDFFSSGGDSLAAARVCAALRHSGVEVSVAEIFRHPRFGEFWQECSLIDDAGAAASEIDGESDDDEEAFDLTPLQLAYALGSDGIPGVVRARPCVAVIIRSDDPCVSSRWESALLEVVARHEVLRLVRCQDWRQRVLASATPEFSEIPFDLTDEQFRELLQRTGVEAGSAPAVRAFVRRSRPSELGLVFNYLALDSLSVASVLRDLADTALGGPQTTTSAADINVFRRYATSRSHASLEDSIAPPPAPVIPTKPIPADEVAFASRGRQLGRTAADGLRAHARRHGVTLNSVLLHAYGAALSAATHQPRVTVNVPTATRPPNAEDALGQFSELALCECGPDMTVPEVHARLGTAIAEAGTLAMGATTQRQRYPVVFTSLLGSPLADDMANGIVRTTWTHTRTPAVLIDCQVIPKEDRGVELRWDYPHGVVSDDFVETAFADCIQRLSALAAAEDRGGQS